MSRHRPFLAFAAALALIFALRAGAGAYGPYPPAATGIDISYPQCQNGLPPSPQAFGLIGVTGGRALYQNPCLITEYAWALTASAPPSFFVNLNAPGGSTAFKANAGPKGFCRPDDTFCLSYNYGYNSVRLAYADAESQETTSSMWWLDIETENSWSDNTAANDQVIQGAVDYLRGQGRTVGVYSTSKQWNQIAGNFNLGVPVWVAGAPDAASAPDFCAPSHAFAGGTIWLVQYVAGDFDNDYACAPQPAGTPPSTQPVSPVTPPVPTGFQATAVNSTSVQLQWGTPTTTINGYAINGYVIVDGGTQIATPNGTGTSYQVTGLGPGSYHCFAISSVSGPGFSPWSPWACVTLPSS